MAKTPSVAVRVIDGMRIAPRLTKNIRVFVKRRWFGKRVDAALAADFPIYDQAYCLRAMAAGKLRVERDGRIVDSPEALVLADHDVIHHDKHHHEPPVLDAPVPVIYEDESLLVVNKPGTMPVHPTSNYWHNTVLAELYRVRPELRASGLFPIHRLDRLTSGVLLFAKSTAASLEVFAAFRRGACAKDYVARVHGHFAAAHRPDAEGWVECRARIGRTFIGARSHYGVSASDTAKDSVSLFRARSYCARTHTSLVDARPLTGRTHQLRIHLAALGTPIVGDSVYGAPPRCADRSTPAIAAALAAEPCEPGCPMCAPPAYETRILTAVPEPLALHAQRLAVSLDSGRKLAFSAEPPASWAEAP